MGLNNERGEKKNIFIFSAAKLTHFRGKLCRKGLEDVGYFQLSARQFKMEVGRIFNKLKQSDFLFFLWHFYSVAQFILSFLKVSCPGATGFRQILTNP